MDSQRAARPRHVKGEQNQHRDEDAQNNAINELMLGGTVRAPWSCASCRRGPGSCGAPGGQRLGDC
eukprot:14291254-Alexandrium_andersonii.AAC.1